MQYNPILFYFYKAFITYDILESCTSDMPDKYLGNSMGCGMIAYANYTSKKEERDNTKDKEDNDKGLPLVKVVRLLASAFTTAIHTNNNQPANDANKEEKYQDSL